MLTCWWCQLARVTAWGREREMGIQMTPPLGECCQQLSQLFSVDPPQRPHQLTLSQQHIRGIYFSHIHLSPQPLMNCSQVPNRCKIRISTYNSPSLDRCSSLFAESRAQTTDQTEWCAPFAAPRLRSLWKHGASNGLEGLSWFATALPSPRIRLYRAVCCPLQEPPF